MIAHPWHEVPHAFDKTNSLVNGIIEISQGSKAKYEVDKETGLLKLDRVVFAAFVYPINYGFIPQTLGDDGDPLDILVLSEVSIEPLCLVHTKVIGVMQMIDSGKSDEKIIAVALGDASVSHFHEVNELPENFKSELKHFFLHYKNLENKTVEVEEFFPRANALDVISKSMRNYSVHFAK